MKWNSATQRMAVCWAATTLGLCVPAMRARADAVGAWHEDPRRPSATLTEGAPVGGADPWHTDVRRPSAALTDNASVSSADQWGEDLRRPDNLDGGSDDSGVSPWRVDDRRPAPWPSAEGADSDHDGVSDADDRCPDTPHGVTVDANGCPGDEDHDGVADNKDRCPDTPIGTRVDRNGCPMSAKETELLDTGTLRLDNVYFDTEKSTIKSESYGALDEVGEILAKWPELRIEIGGHTDNTGTSSYNRDLSDARAAAVKDYLTSKFSLQKDQYTSKGYGETKPVASNDSSDGRAKNRRVEFKVLNREVLRK
jgi:outer membrane protein OmpA-like peptidoglycan-associated protein